MATKVKDWKWSWLFFQVLLPLPGPIVISLIAWLFLRTTDNVPMSREVIVDVTPWALIFFTMALLGAAFHDIWPNLGSHIILGVVLLVLTILVFMYIQHTVSWRIEHPRVEPDRGVWVTAFTLLAGSIVTGYLAAK
jgi:hypothetical protein